MLMVHQNKTCEVLEITQMHNSLRGGYGTDFGFRNFSAPLITGSFHYISDHPDMHTLRFSPNFSNGFSLFF